MTLFARAISICVLSSVTAAIFAQGLPNPQDRNMVTRRIKIRKADPALIMLLLSGSQSTQVAPEISTLQKLGNGGFGGSGFGGSSSSGQFGSRDGSNSGRQGPSTGGGGDRGGRHGG